MPTEFNMNKLSKRSIPDEKYNTHILINQKKGLITAIKFDEILQLPLVKNKLEALFNKYGILSSVSLRKNSLISAQR